MKKIILDYNNKGHYSPAIISNGMLYVSGQLPIDFKSGKIIGSDIDNQFNQVLKNIDYILTKAGITKNQIVQTRIYISDINNWDIINEIYSKYLLNHKPARIVVPCSTLHQNSLVEMEVIAEMEN